MSKYRLTGLLFGFIGLWSMAFGVYKYFFWGYLKGEGNTAGVSLETIAGNLSLGAIGAFIIGSIVFTLYKEKRILHTIIWFAIASIGCYVYFGNKSIPLFAILTITFGAIYALWSIVRNILISMEIERTGLKDTLVNGISNIVFIVSLILGSIIGGVFVEKFGDKGSIGLLFLFVIASILTFFATYSRDQSLPKKDIQLIEIKKYAITAPKRLQKTLIHYWNIMFPAAVLLVIATLVSQKAIDYSVTVLHVAQSSATMILLYSAVGSIFGNILSMKIHANRWKAFAWTLGAFAILMGAAPIFFESFGRMSVFAFLAGIFFGTAYNFVESYFFVKIAEEDNKADGAVVYGITCSLTMTICMFLVNTLFPIISYAGVFYVICGGLILLTITSTIASKKWN